MAGRTDRKSAFTSANALFRSGHRVVCEAARTPFHAPSLASRNFTLPTDWGNANGGGSPACWLLVVVARACTVAGWRGAMGNHGEQGSRASGSAVGIPVKALRNSRDTVLGGDVRLFLRLGLVDHVGSRCSGPQRRHLRHAGHERERAQPGLRTRLLRNAACPCSRHARGVEERRAPRRTSLRVGRAALRPGRGASDEHVQRPAERDAGCGRGSACRRSCKGSLAVLLGAVAVLELGSCGCRGRRPAPCRCRRPGSRAIPRGNTSSPGGRRLSGWRPSDPNSRRSP